MSGFQRMVVCLFFRHLPLHSGHGALADNLPLGVQLGVFGHGHDGSIWIDDAAWKALALHQRVGILAPCLTQVVTDAHPDFTIFIWIALHPNSGYPPVGGLNDFARNTAQRVK